MLPVITLPPPFERASEERPQLPCWLTEEEAEAILIMCAASPRTAGSVERQLFAKLGELLRAYRR